MKPTVHIATSAPCRGMHVPRRTLGFVTPDDGEQRVASLYFCSVDYYACPHHPPVMRLAARGGLCDVDIDAIEFQWDAFRGWWHEADGVVPIGSYNVVADYLDTAANLVKGGLAALRD